MIDSTCYYIPSCIRFIVPLFLFGLEVLLFTAAPADAAPASMGMECSAVEWSGVDGVECVCAGREVCLAAHSICVQTHVLCQQFTPVRSRILFLYYYCLLCRCMPWCFSGMKMQLWRARGGENNPVEESYFRGQNDRLGYRAWPAGYNLEKRMTQLGIPRAFWTKSG